MNNGTNQNQQGLSKSQRRRRNRQARQNSANTQQIILPQSMGPVRVLTSSVPAVRNRKNSRRSRRGVRKAKGIGGITGASSLYFKTLSDPEHFPGVKIPDISAFPSGTFQMTYDGVLPTGAGDSVGLLLIPIISNGVGQAPITLLKGSSPGSLGVLSSVYWAKQAAITALYSSFRPVSASIQASFIGPSLSDGGQIAGALLPREDHSGINSFDVVLALPNSVSGPLRNGIVVNWRPQDNSDMEYQGPIPDNEPPSIFVAATGIPANSNYLKVRVVVNFEGVAETDVASIVSTSSSPVDPIGMSKVLTLIGSSPVAMSLLAFGAREASRFAMNGIQRNMERLAINY